MSNRFTVIEDDESLSRVVSHSFVGTYDRICSRLKNVEFPTQNQTLQYIDYARVYIRNEVPLTVLMLLVLATSLLLVRRCFVRRAGHRIYTNHLKYL